MAEAQQVTSEMKQLARDIVAEVEQRVQGCDDVATSQAAYIAKNRLRERGVPPWAIDLLMEVVMELIKRFMNSRQQPGGEIQPAMVESRE